MYNLERKGAPGSFMFQLVLNEIIKRRSGLICTGIKGRLSSGKDPTWPSLQPGEGKDPNHSCKQRLMLMWFCGVGIHPKLAMSSCEEDSWVRGSWSLSSWFQRAAEARYCVVGKSLCESLERTRDPKRLFYKAGEVKPGCVWDPRMLEMPELWDIYYGDLHTRNGTSSR